MALQGHQMTGPVVGSAGLAQQQAQQNAQQPHGINRALTANGMAASTASQTMNGSLPSQNGMASDQYEQARFMMRKD